MDWHPGAGYFPLLILCFVISWVPSQEVSLQVTLSQKTTSKEVSPQEGSLKDLKRIIINLHRVAENLYVVYNKLESSLSNFTDILLPYQPKWNLSEIWIKSSEFLKKLEKIKDFKIFEKNFTLDIIHATYQLKNLQEKLNKLDTISPLLDTAEPTPKDTFNRKLFALNTFKKFFHFMTCLSDNFTREEIKHPMKRMP